MAGFMDSGVSTNIATTTAGLILNSHTAPAATNAYVNYDGTNVGINAPTGKGIAFTVNGSNVATISTTGKVGVPGTSSTTGFGTLSGFNIWGGSSAVTGHLDAAVSDGSSAVAWTLNNIATFSTPGAKLLSVQNNGANDGLDVYAVVSANPTTMGGQVAVSHLAGGSGLPTGVAAGAGAGTSSLPTNAGSDLGGTIGVTCGSAGTGGATVVSFTWAHAYNTAPYVTISPANSATAALSGATQVFPTPGTTTLAITAGATAPPAGTYLWYYKVNQ